MRPYAEQLFTEEDLMIFRSAQRVVRLIPPETRERTSGPVFVARGEDLINCHMVARVVVNVLEAKLPQIRVEPRVVDGQYSRGQDHSWIAWRSTNGYPVILDTYAVWCVPQVIMRYTERVDPSYLPNSLPRIMDPVQDRWIQELTAEVIERW